MIISTSVCLSLWNNDRVHPRRSSLAHFRFSTRLGIQIQNICDLHQYYCARNRLPGLRSTLTSVRHSSKKRHSVTNFVFMSSRFSSRVTEHSTTICTAWTPCSSTNLGGNSQPVAFACSKLNDDLNPSDIQTLYQLDIYTTRTSYTTHS
jgi:hypothetical protein